MKVLVTGGAGYIGSHAVRQLRDEGHEVTVLDDLSAGHRVAVPGEVPLVTGSLLDPAALDRALEGADAVMHFAGLVSVADSAREPGRYWQVNVVGTLALLDRMRARGVGRLVFSSTCAVYGMPQQVPMEEDHPQSPISPYGATKKAAEMAIADHAKAGGLRAIALRYFNAAGCHPDGTLGEDHRPEQHLIPLAIDAALGRGPGLTIHGTDYDTDDGTCVRDYIHVLDLARAHVAALKALDAAPAFQAVNLGTGRGNSVLEVIRAVEAVSGRAVPHRVGPRRPGDPPRLVAGAGRARKALGFVAQHSDLGTIVESALRWRRDHGTGYAA